MVVVENTLYDVLEAVETVTVLNVDLVIFLDGVVVLCLFCF